MRLVLGDSISGNQCPPTTPEWILLARVDQVCFVPEAEGCKEPYRDIDHPAQPFSKRPRCRDASGFITLDHSLDLLFG